MTRLTQMAKCNWYNLAGLQPVAEKDANKVFWTALRFGATEVVALLLHRNPINLFLRQYALTYAVQQGCYEIIALLLQDPQIQPNYHHLRMAIEEEHLWIVSLLLCDGRIDPSNALCTAVKNDVGVGLLSLLLSDPRVNPAAQNQFPIRYGSNFIAVARSPC